MIELGVNIDHVATIRQARRTYEPDPVWAAVEAHLGGADGITVHLREDRRHIQDADVRRLRELTHIKLNLEMAATDEMVGIACDLKPEMAMLVPEGRHEVTTEGGLDVVQHSDKVARVIDAMNAAGIKTSLFIDPDPEQITMAARLQAPWIELHTGAYANHYHDAGRAGEFARLVAGAKLAHAAGLVANAGHGINYTNITEVRTIPHLHELNIGHSIISRALVTGIDEAVRAMKALMNP